MKTLIPKTLEDDGSSQPRCVAWLKDGGRLMVLRASPGREFTETDVELVALALMQDQPSR